MKKIIVLSFAIFLSFQINAQKYFTKEGKISFESKTSMEKIDAINNKATSVIDLTSGAIEWSVLIKAFSFEKALMQEHFNENYMESGKFPKAVFKGKITNPSAINLAKDGSYTVDVSGTLEMHGVSKPLNTKATFIVKGGTISATSKIKAALADYKIEIPSVVKNNIAKEVDIMISANYAPFTK